MAVQMANQTGTPAGETRAGGDSRMPGPREQMPGAREQMPGAHEHSLYTVLALGIAVPAFLVAWALHGNASSSYHIDTQWGALTGLFILALAVERAVEPFSRMLGPDTAKRKDARDMALASARADDMAEIARAKIAMEHQLKVDRCRRLTAVLTWGVATGLAFLLCGQLNITLMQTVRAGNSGAPPFWADLLVTGLVVGAGTKPLHRLFATFEPAKQGHSHGKNPAR